MRPISDFGDGCSGVLDESLPGSVTASCGSRVFVVESSVRVGCIGVNVGCEADVSEDDVSVVPLASLESFVRGSLGADEGSEAAGFPSVLTRARASADGFWLASACVICPASRYVAATAIRHKLT